MVSTEAMNLLFKTIKKGSLEETDKMKKEVKFDERLPPFIDLVNYIEERRAISEPSLDDQKEPIIYFIKNSHSEVMEELNLFKKLLVNYFLSWLCFR